MSAANLSSALPTGGIGSDAQHERGADFDSADGSVDNSGSNVVKSMKSPLVAAAAEIFDDVLRQSCTAVLLRAINAAAGELPSGRPNAAGLSSPAIASLAPLPIAEAGPGASASTGHQRAPASAVATSLELAIHKHFRGSTGNDYRDAVRRIAFALPRHKHLGVALLVKSLAIQRLIEASVSDQLPKLSEHVHDELELGAGVHLGPHYLPPDQGSRLLSFLSAHDMCRFACVCRAYRVLSGCSAIWRALVHADFSIRPPPAPPSTSSHDAEGSVALPSDQRLNPAQPHALSPPSSLSASTSAAAMFELARRSEVTPAAPVAVIAAIARAKAMQQLEQDRTGSSSSSWLRPDAPAAGFGARGDGAGSIAVSGFGAGRGSGTGAGSALPATTPSATSQAATATGESSGGSSASSPRYNSSNSNSRSINASITSVADASGKPGDPWAAIRRPGESWMEAYKRKARDRAFKRRREAMPKGPCSGCGAAHATEQRYHCRNMRTISYTVCGRCGKVEVLEDEGGDLPGMWHC